MPLHLICSLGAFGLYLHFFMSPLFLNSLCDFVSMYYVEASGVDLLLLNYDFLASSTKATALFFCYCIFVVGLLVSFCFDPCSLSRLAYFRNFFIPSMCIYAIILGSIFVGFCMGPYYVKITSLVFRRCSVKATLLIDEGFYVLYAKRNF